MLQEKPKLKILGGKLSTLNLKSVESDSNLEKHQKLKVVYKEENKRAQFQKSNNPYKLEGSEDDNLKTAVNFRSTLRIKKGSIQLISSAFSDSIYGKKQQYENIRGNRI